MGLQETIGEFVKEIEEIAARFKETPLDAENLTRARTLIETMARTEPLDTATGNTLAKQLAKALESAASQYTKLYAQYRKEFEKEQAATMPNVQHEMPFSYEARCEAPGSHIVRFILAKHGEHVKYNPHTKQVMAYDHDSGIWKRVGEPNSIEYKTIVVSYIKEYIENYDGMGTGYDASLINSVANMLLTEICQYEWNHIPFNIALMNEYLSIGRTGEFKIIEPDPSFYVTHQINAEYDSEAKCPTIDKFIEQLTSYDGKPSPAKIERFLAFIRVILTVKIHRYQKFLHLYGPSGSGKTTALKLISKIIPNFQETSLSALETGGFELGKLSDADLIIISEADDEYTKFLGNKSIFKKMTSGDYAPRDKKHTNLNGDESTFQAHAAFILATEEPLKGGMSIQRRSCGIGCNYIPQQAEYFDLMEQFEAELPGFLNRILTFTETQALEIINRGPAESALEIKREAKETLLAGNYLFQWLDACVVYITPPTGYPDTKWNTTEHPGVTIGKLTEKPKEVGRGYEHADKELLPSLYNWGLESGDRVYQAIRQYSKQNLANTLINILKYQWRLPGIERVKTNNRRLIYGIALRSAEDPNDSKADYPSVVDIYLGLSEPLKPSNQNQISQPNQPHEEPGDDVF